MNFTADIEAFIKKIRTKINPQQVAAFMAVLAVGFIAHGFVFFNRISYHDNTADLFALGSTYEVDRWGLGIISDLQLITVKTFSLPLFNGILSLLFIGLAAMKLVDIFKLRSKVSAAMTGAIMVTFPVVASIFSFMFTSWPYFMGLFFAVEAAGILIKEKNIKSFLLSALCLAIMLGLYQAFLAVTIAMFLTELFLGVVSGDCNKVITYIKHGFTYLASLVVGLLFNTLIATFFKKLRHATVFEYKGRGDSYDIAAFPGRLFEALKEFFACDWAGLNGVRFLRTVALCIILATLVQLAFLLAKSAKSVGLKLIAALGVLLLPIAMNVVYLLSTSDEYYVDSLMVYGLVFVYIIPLLLIDAMEHMDISQKTLAASFTRIVTWLQLIAICVMTISYIYTSNAAYLKGSIAQEQATSYFNQLIACIKSTEGYSQDMEIIFVGMDSNEDATFVDIDPLEQLDAIKIENYPEYFDLVGYGSALAFMREHCGFGNDLVSIDDGTYAAKAAIKAMPTYPNDGGIAIIDGQVIVKMGD